MISRQSKFLRNRPFIILWIAIELRGVNSFIFMASFNTYDYQFLIRCLTEGSLVFRCEALKRLTFLAQNDKKQFQAYSKNILNAMEDLYKEEKQDINIMCTLLLSQIILGAGSKENEEQVKARHLRHLIENLGHTTKPAIRKASHTCLLAFAKSYHNFDGLLEQYLDHGFDNENALVKQKAINSFQSIFILEVKSFSWDAESAKRLLQSMISKAGDENLQIAKAAAQCLLSLCKNEGIKATAALLSVGYLQKLSDFMSTTQEKLPGIELKVSVDQIALLIENTRKRPRQEPFKQEALKQETLKQETPQAQTALQIPKIQQKSVEAAQNVTYQRRLQKIRKSMADNEQKQKRGQKQQNGGINFVKMFANLANESSIKDRTEAVEDILFKIQAHKNRPQFEGSIKSCVPSILKLFKDTNPKIVGLTLKILENVVQELKSTDPALQNLISVVIQKLGDPKISIRQIVSKVIRELVMKTDKALWISELLENIKKNTNTFLKDETLSIIHYIYEESEVPEIKYPVDELVDRIVVFTDDPKTKIKIRTLDCLAQIIVKSGEVGRFNEKLRQSMSDVFFQMYTEKVNKILHDLEKKKNAELQKRKKNEETSNFRSTYQQRNNYRKEQKQSDDENQLNVSLGTMKKRIIAIKNKRNALSTRETSSLDRTYRTMDKSEIPNNEDQDLVLPSLDKKIQTNKISTRKKSEVNYFKTIDNKGSDYMSKQELKPLAEPEKQFRNVLADLKSSDWKVQFETTNKLRRLTQFHPELLLSAPSTTVHAIILDILSYIESLRSSVSKNALICLNEIVLALGRQVDSEMEVVLEKLMKKAADTNVFISSEVHKCLRSLSVSATPSKLLQKIAIYKDSKNYPIKDALLNVLLGMKDEQKIRSKQYGRLCQLMAFFLGEGQVDLRTKAKAGIVDICTELGDWYRFLRGKVTSSAFKLICDIITKNSNMSTTLSPETCPSPVRLNRKVLANSVDLKTFTLEPKTKEDGAKQQAKTGVRKSFIKIQQFPHEFDQISGLIDLSSSSEWKKRIESTQGLKLLALKFPGEFVQFRSSCHFVDILSKQIAEPNLKVSVNAMEIFLEVLDPLQKLVESNLSVICASIFNALSSTKVEVREMAEQCTSSIVQKFESQTILQFLCHGILYSLPKSRVYLLVKLQEHFESIHNEKKQLLYKHVFPLLNKLMEEYKPELMPHVVNFFLHMYDVMGNNMFAHIAKFKEVRELIGK